MSIIFKDDIHYKNGMSCADCHGGDPNEDDGNLSMNASRGFKLRVTHENVPEYCGRCHSDAAFMGKHKPGQRADQAALYRKSVHGEQLAKGNTKAANCVDCHGVHNIRAVDDPQSPVSPSRLAAKCGFCHGEVAGHVPTEPARQGFHDEWNGRLFGVPLEPCHGAGRRRDAHRREACLRGMPRGRLGRRQGGRRHGEEDRRSRAGGPASRCAPSGARFEAGALTGGARDFCVNLTSSRGGIMARTNRRDFLRQSLAAGSAAALPVTAWPAQVRRASDVIELGPAKVRVSRLALGTGTIGGGHSSNQMRKLGADGVADVWWNAYDNGVFFWDTADQIRQPRRRQGRAESEEDAAREGHRPDQGLRPQRRDMKSSLDRYLQEMGTDYIDIVLIHSRMSPEVGRAGQGRDGCAVGSQAGQEGAVGGDQLPFRGRHESGRRRAPGWTSACAG